MDDFQRYALSLFNKPLSSYGPDSAYAKQHGTGLYEQLRDPAEAQYAWSFATSPFLDSGASGGSKSWVRNSFANAWTKYRADQAKARSEGRDFKSWYDWTTSDGMDYLRDSYYRASPRERGFSLGGGVPTSRFVRSF